MVSGEVCVNYADGSQLKLNPSGSSAVAYTDTHGHEMRYGNSIYPRPPKRRKQAWERG